ncbi:hypothetical protein Tco_0061005, partial [Tanacetum coccineum]
LEVVEKLLEEEMLEALVDAMDVDSG